MPKMLRESTIAQLLPLVMILLATLTAMINAELMNLVVLGERKVMSSFKVASKPNIAILLPNMRVMILLTNAHKVQKVVLKQHQQHQHQQHHNQLDHKLLLQVMPIQHQMPPQKLMHLVEDTTIA